MKLLNPGAPHKSRWTNSQFSWNDARTGSRLRSMLKQFMEYKLPTDLCDSAMWPSAAFRTWDAVAGSTSMGFSNTFTATQAQTFQASASHMPINLAAGDSIVFNWTLGAASSMAAMRATGMGRTLDAPRTSPHTLLASPFYDVDFDDGPRRRRPLIGRSHDVPVPEKPTRDQRLGRFRLYRHFNP